MLVGRLPSLHDVLTVEERAFTKIICCVHSEYDDGFWHSRENYKVVHTTHRIPGAEGDFAGIIIFVSPLRAMTFATTLSTPKPNRLLFHMGTLTADVPRLAEHCPHKLPSSCRLTSIPLCCACADRRPHSTSYSKYVDGVGLVQRGTRWQNYCWFCKSTISSWCP